MGLIEKNTMGNMVVIIANILIFNGMKNSPTIGPFILKYPWITIAVGIALIVFIKKILPVLAFMETSSAKEFIFIMSSVFIFNGLLGISQIAAYLTQYAYIAIISGIVLLMAKEQIANIGGN